MSLHSTQFRAQLMTAYRIITLFGACAYYIGEEECFVEIIENSGAPVVSRGAVRSAASSYMQQCVAGSRPVLVIA